MSGPVGDDGVEQGLQGLRVRWPRTGRFRR
jgi:hypothetical protein